MIRRSFCLRLPPLWNSLVHCSAHTHTQRSFGFAFISPGVVLITGEDNCNASFTIIAGFDIVHESLPQLHSIFHIWRLFVFFTRLAVALSGCVWVSVVCVSALLAFWFVCVCVFAVWMWLWAYGISRGSFVNSCFASIFHLYSITHSNELRWRASERARDCIHRRINWPHCNRNSSAESVSDTLAHCIGF